MLIPMTPSVCKFADWALRSWRQSSYISQQKDRFRQGGQIFIYYLDLFLSLFSCLCIVTMQFSLNWFLESRCELIELRFLSLYFQSNSEKVYKFIFNSFSNHSLTIVVGGLFVFRDFGLLKGAMEERWCTVVTIIQRIG